MGIFTNDGPNPVYSLLNQIFRLGKVNLVVCIKNLFF